MPPRHLFAYIAPEANDEELPDGKAETWRWCIRCGVLRLGKEFFLPGPKQRLVVVGTDSAPPCVLRKSSKR